VQFLQKPFDLHVMANMAHWMARTVEPLQPSESLVLAKTDSG
jgi:hypothetical protein